MYQWTSLHHDHEASSHHFHLGVSTIGRIRSVASHWMQSEGCLWLVHWLNWGWPPTHHPSDFNWFFSFLPLQIQNTNIWERNTAKIFLTNPIHVLKRLNTTVTRPLTLKEERHQVTSSWPEDEELFLWQDARHFWLYSSCSWCFNILA